MITPSATCESFSRAQPRGMVLVVVLVVVSLLTLAALTFSQLMLAEREATELTGRRLQSRASANSAIAYIQLFLLQDEESQLELGGIYDNPLEFSGKLLLDDLDVRDRARFAIISPNLVSGEYSGIRYGLEDESTKLNLNAVAALDAEGGTGRDILMMLPGMTENVADAILDWIDEDDETRDYGAEMEHYSVGVPAYEPKNGPLDSIDELLLVEGVTPWLLYGVDANRNGNADSVEPGGESLTDVDNTDGSLDCGWAAYLTVHSFENNTNAEGEAKINLNQDDLEALHGELEEALSTEWATFICAYRMNGPYTGNEQGEAPPASGVDFSGDATEELVSVLDLVGVKTEIQSGGQNNPQTTVLAPVFSEESGSMAEYLPTLLDAVTVADSETISGRININQAPRTVLLTIPGMTEEAADQIIYGRIEDPTLAEEDQTCSAWPLINGLVDLETMKSVERYVCTGGNVYGAQVVGYCDGGGPSTRIEVLIDATQSPAALLSWKDISHLGRGYPLEMLGIE